MRILFILSLVIALGSQGAECSDNTACLACHGERSLVKTFSDGKTMSLFVDGKELSLSAHSSLNCTDCHSMYSGGNHPERKFKNRIEFRNYASEACMRCHRPEGVHKRMIASNSHACVDCHGSHSAKQAEGEDSCLGCHKSNIKITFGDGTTIDVKIDETDIMESVHSRLRCYDCHFGFSKEEHPRLNFRTKKDLTIVASEGCRRCHFDKYTKTLEGIHYDLLSKGNLGAPVCADCHGSHSISSGRREKILSARKCQKCHEGIYKIYIGSVHGSALISEHNQDVPVCSDCHRAHDLSDPHTADFRNRTPEMCGRCHSDERLMAKYGLSTNVLRSYLEDFHGVTVTLYKKQRSAPRKIAVCTDCHGIHDITKVKGPNATILKSNLITRCRKCHPNATEKFPDSWISHYDPSFKRAPLVYAVVITYRFFIPFMIIGLVLQIILHIWRYAVNR